MSDTIPGPPLTLQERNILHLGRVWEWPEGIAETVIRIQRSMPDGYAIIWANGDKYPWKQRGYWARYAPVSLATLPVELYGATEDEIRAAVLADYETRKDGFQWGPNLTELVNRYADECSTHGFIP